MDILQFLKYRNFFLKRSKWGDAEDINVVNLLDNVVFNFYENLNINLINDRTVLVANSSWHNPPRNHPEIITIKDTSYIFLSTKDRFWCQYAYQFSHELCHYVIDTPFPQTNDKFGWFEESICELASIFTLEKMSLTWTTNPPYSNWVSYSTTLSLYVDNIKNDRCEINNPFSHWLRQNLITLYNDRINRQLNRNIALTLLPIFKDYPNLWQIIHYLNLVVVTSEMNLIDYLYELKKNLPTNLVYEFRHIEEILLVQT